MIYRRSVLIAIIISSIFVQCNNPSNSNPPQYFNLSGINYGGCNLSNNQSLRKTALNYTVDTITWSFNNQTLNCHVGFNTACCRHFLATADTLHDTLYITIIDTAVATCRCICYYTFDFNFQIGDSLRHGNYLLRAFNATDSANLLFTRNGTY
jgi:hypothetical protein